MNVLMASPAESDYTAFRGLVLVVDDDTRTARRLAAMLRDDGYLAEVAADGAAAIARLSRAPIPDALITDLHIPHVDGASVAAYARSRRPALPIIVVTGHPELRSSLDAMRPSVRVLSKPADYDEIVRALDDGVDSAPVSSRRVG